MIPAFARIVVALAIAGTPGGACAADYRKLPGGTFDSVLPADGKAAPVTVAPFRLRTEPVSNAEFLAFTQTQPRWRRDRVARLFAESRYLEEWKSPNELGSAAPADRAVTQVSWYAARAYCESEGARLPTWHEWEFAAAADATRADARSDAQWRERILNWYAKPSSGTLAPLGQTPANVYGIADLHGLVWEWVDDFASLMVSGDNRNQGDPDLLKFCGAGALSTQQKDNYAVLMRVALLSSLKAADTTRNLGFRCARDGEEQAP